MLWSGTQEYYAAYYAALYEQQQKQLAEAAATSAADVDGGGAATSAAAAGGEMGEGAGGEQGGEEGREGERRGREKRGVTEGERPLSGRMGRQEGMEQGQAARPMGTMTELGMRMGMVMMTPKVDTMTQRQMGEGKMWSGRIEYALRMVLYSTPYCTGTFL